MKAPDTEVPCRICGGTKLTHGHECGACFGTGLSSAPEDQRRCATTITIWESESETQKRNLPAGFRFEGPGKATMRMNRDAVENGMIYLVSWPYLGYWSDSRPGTRKMERFDVVSCETCDRVGYFRALGMDGEIGEFRFCECSFGEELRKADPGILYRLTELAARNRAGLTNQPEPAKKGVVQ